MLGAILSMFSRGYLLVIDPTLVLYFEWIVELDVHHQQHRI